MQLNSVDEAKLIGKNFTYTKSIESDEKKVIGSGYMYKEKHSPKVLYEIRERR